MTESSAVRSCNPAIDHDQPAVGVSGTAVAVADKIPVTQTDQGVRQQPCRTSPTYESFESS